MSTTNVPVKATPTATPPAKIEPAKTKAIAPFKPADPVGNVGTLKSLIEQRAGSLADLLPKHVTSERLAKTMLIAVNRNAAILQCTQSSVIESIYRAAELGLDVSGTLGEAYLVPFNNKVKVNNRDTFVKQLQLLIGYRGMEKLAWQTEQVTFIDAEVVYAKDDFDFSKGTELSVKWKPFLGGDRGQVVGAYCCIGLKAGGKIARFLPVSDLEKIRNSSMSKDSPAWRNWRDEMYRKCAIKRTLKDAPLSTERLSRALGWDNEDQAADVLQASTRRNRDLNAPLDALPLRPADTDADEAGADDVVDAEISDAAEPDESEIPAAAK